jgi:hypothetical protein
MDASAVREYVRQGDWYFTRLERFMESNDPPYEGWNVGRHNMLGTQRALPWPPPGSPEFCRWIHKIYGERGIDEQTKRVSADLTLCAEIRQFLLSNNDDVSLMLVNDSIGIEIASKFDRALRRYLDEAGILWKQMRPRIMHAAERLETGAAKSKKKRGRSFSWRDADLRIVHTLWGTTKWRSVGAFVEANRAELPTSILNYDLGAEVGVRRALDAARKPGRLAGTIRVQAE